MGGGRGNDLLIIATAKQYKGILVSNEGKQTKLPKTLAKMKIPAVCGMAQVEVRCINFIEFLRESKNVFR